MDADKCSVCGDDLLPDEGAVCWQCDGKLGDAVALPMSTADRLLAGLVALLAYLALAW